MDNFDERTPQVVPSSSNDASFRSEDMNTDECFGVTPAGSRNGLTDDSALSTECGPRNPPEVPFDLENSQDEGYDSEMIEMIGVNQKIAQAYLSERYAPKILRNPLEDANTVQLRHANMLTLKQLRQSYPSLEPRERILYASAKLAAHRSTYLLQSFVAQRLWKILQSPYAVRKSVENRAVSVLPHEKFCSSKTPFAQNATASNSFSSGDARGSRITPLCQRSETQALVVLEQALTHDIKVLWDTFSVLAPVESATEQRIVHARVPFDASPVPFDALHLSDAVQFLRSLPASETTQLNISPPYNSGASQSQSSVSSSLTSTKRTLLQTGSGGTSVPQLLPGTVLTIGFDVVRDLVERGDLNLIG